MGRQDKQLPLAADNIEVTPEMIEAGLEECDGGRWDDFAKSLEDVLRDAYRAMFAVAQVRKRGRTK